jgi:hypothetical protein
VQHGSDKASAEQDLVNAEAVRSKEQADFDTDSAASASNITAVGNAIPALEKGIGGS